LTFKPERFVLDDVPISTFFFSFHFIVVFNVFKADGIAAYEAQKAAPTITQTEEKRYQRGGR